MTLEESYSITEMLFSLYCRCVREFDWHGYSLLSVTLINNETASTVSLIPQVQRKLLIGFARWNVYLTRMSEFYC